MSKIGKIKTKEQGLDLPDFVKPNEKIIKEESLEKNDVILEMDKEPKLIELVECEQILERPIEEEKGDRSMEISESKENPSKITSLPKENKTCAELTETSQTKFSTRPTKKSAIVSEIDKIFSNSPNKNPKKVPVIEKSLKFSAASASPMKKYHSTENLILKKEPLYDQLYKIGSKPRPEVTDEQPKPTPTRRHTEIDKDLYEDAVRRASIHYDPEECSEITTGRGSQRVLAKKYAQEFCVVCENYSIYNVNFEVYKHLLIEFRFLKEEMEEQDITLVLKLWNIINVQDQERISLEKTLSSHLALLGIYCSQVIVPSLNLPESLNPNILASSLPIQLEMRIHKTFHRLVDNRRVSCSPKVKPSQPGNFTFAPQLSPESKAMARKKNDDLGGLSSEKRLEHYLSEKKKLQEKAEKEKQQKEEQALKECTFCPKILKKNISPMRNNKHKTLELYEMSKKEKEQTKSTAELVIEKEMAECTFQPRIQKKKLKEETSGLYSKSVQQQIARMQKAREEELRKKRILETRSPMKEYIGEREKNSSPLGKSPTRVMPMINLSDFEHYDVKEATNESEDAFRVKA